MGRIFDIVPAVRRGSMPPKGAMQCKLQIRFSFNWTSELFQTESELLNYLIQLLNMQSGIQRHVLATLLAFLLTGTVEIDRCWGPFLERPAVNYRAWYEKISTLNNKSSQRNGYKQPIK